MIDIDPIGYDFLAETFQMIGEFFQSQRIRYFWHYRFYFGQFVFAVRRRYLRLHQYGVILQYFDVIQIYSADLTRFDNYTRKTESTFVEELAGQCYGPMAFGRFISYSA